MPTKTDDRGAARRPGRARQDHRRPLHSPGNGPQRPADRQGRHAADRRGDRKAGLGRCLHPPDRRQPPDRNSGADRPERRRRHRQRVRHHRAPAVGGVPQEVAVRPSDLRGDTAVLQPPDRTDPRNRCGVPRRTPGRVGTRTRVRPCVVGVGVAPLPDVHLRRAGLRRTLSTPLSSTRGGACFSSRARSSPG